MKKINEFSYLLYLILTAIMVVLAIRLYSIDIQTTAEGIKRVGLVSGVLFGMSVFTLTEFFVLLGNHIKKSVKTKKEALP